MFSAILKAHVAQGSINLNGTPSLVAMQQSIPGAGGQGIDMDVAAASGGAHHKPPAQCASLALISKGFGVAVSEIHDLAEH